MTQNTTGNLPTSAAAAQHRLIHRFVRSSTNPLPPSRRFPQTGATRGSPARLAFRASKPGHRILRWASPIASHGSSLSAPSPAQLEPWMRTSDRRLAERRVWIRTCTYLTDSNQRDGGHAIVEKMARCFPRGMACSPSVMDGRLDAEIGPHARRTCGRAKGRAELTLWPALGTYPTAEFWPACYPRLTERGSRSHWSTCARS